MIAEKVGATAKLTTTKLKDRATGDEMPEPFDQGSDGKVPVDGGGFGSGPGNLRRVADADWRALGHRTPLGARRPPSDKSATSRPGVLAEDLRPSQSHVQASPVFPRV